MMDYSVLNTKYPVDYNDFLNRDKFEPFGPHFEPKPYSE